MIKLNCWDFKKCGRHSGEKRGTCPAYTEKRLDGVHGGTNAGRACWVVSGTLCRGKVQGTFVQKYSDCIECTFFQMLLKEEGKQRESTSKLSQKLLAKSERYG
jgi:hypothetical protein